MGDNVLYRGSQTKAISGNKATSPERVIKTKGKHRKEEFASGGGVRKRKVGVGVLRGD